MAQKKLKIFVVAGEASGDIYGGLFAENKAGENVGETSQVVAE